MRAGHRQHHAPGHLRALHPQLRVDARDDDVEPAEHVVGHVEAAVLEDVDLHAGEDAERARRFSLSSRDLVELLAQPLGGQAVGDREPRRVIGQDHVLVAEILRGAGHRLDRCAAVGPDRVGVAVALERSADLAALADRDARSSPRAAGRYAGRLAVERLRDRRPVLSPMPGSSLSRPRRASVRSSSGSVARTVSAALRNALAFTRRRQIAVQQVRDAFERLHRIHSAKVATEAPSEAPATRRTRGKQRAQRALEAERSTCPTTLDRDGAVRVRRAPQRGQVGTVQRARPAARPPSRRTRSRPPRPTSGWPPFPIRGSTRLAVM